MSLAWALSVSRLWGRRPDRSSASRKIFGSGFSTPTSWESMTNSSQRMSPRSVRMERTDPFEFETTAARTPASRTT